MEAEKFMKTMKKVEITMQMFVKCCMGINYHYEHTVCPRKVNSGHDLMVTKYTTLQVNPNPIHTSLTDFAK